MPFTSQLMIGAAVLTFFDRYLKPAD